MEWIHKEIKMARTLHSFKEHLNKHLATQQAQSSWLIGSLSLREWGPSEGSWYWWGGLMGVGPILGFSFSHHDSLVHSLCESGDPKKDLVLSGRGSIEWWRSLCWWGCGGGEEACGCLSYFGVFIQRGLSAWGWEGLKLAGGNPNR